MKTILKNYFEDLIKTDSAMKCAYEENKIEECIKYIRSRAQKQAKDGFAAVEDAVVYKWARDFMLGDVEKTTAEKTVDAVNAESDEEIMQEDEIIKEEKTVIKTKKQEPVPEYKAQILFDF